MGSTKAGTIDPLAYVCYCVSALPDELQLRRQVAGEVQAHLQRLFPYVDELSVFGSTSRETSLSSRVDASSDVDLLFAVKFAKHNAFMSAYRGTGSPWHLWVESIRDVLSYTSSFKDLVLDQPCVCFKYDDVYFQLFPAMASSQAGTYIFNRPITHWEYQNRDLMQRYTGSGYIGAPEANKDGQKIEMTDPFRFNRHVPKFVNVYRGAWRSLVLLLKYWKLTCSTKVGLTSYVIEYNVLAALEHVERFSTCKTILDLLTTFLRSEDLYDAKLLHRSAEFLRLRERILRADQAQKAGHLHEAARLVLSVVPRPSPPPGKAQRSR